MTRLITAVSFALAVGGCTYKADTDVTPATNVYSNYSDKISGRFALYVNADDMKQDIKPSGYGCNFHTFPVDARSAFAISTVKTFENLLEEVEVVDAPLTSTALSQGGYKGMVVVEVEDLDVDIRVIPGFWTAEVEADAEVTARLTVDGIDGRLVGTTVEGDQDHRGPAGIACDGGAPAVGKAVEEAMKETLERLGERLTNATRLRQ